MFTSFIITLDKKPKILEYMAAQNRSIQGLTPQHQLDKIHAEIIKLAQERDHYAPSLCDSYRKRDRALILRELLENLYIYPLPSWIQVVQLDGIESAIKECEKIMA